MRSNNKFSFFGIQHIMTKIRPEERVGDLAAAHQINHLGVLGDLVAFEFVNGQLTLVNIEEVNQLSVVLNVLVGMFDLQLQCLDALLNAQLRLKKGLQCCLTGTDFV